MTHDLTVLSLVVGAMCAVVTPVYGPARHLVTAVHEVGHALVALCVGRRLRSIRLNRDSSGEAVSAGRSSGPGVVLTLAAGYPAPTAVGFAGVVAVCENRVELWLLGMLVVLAMMLVVLRGAFGLVVMTAIVLAIVALLRWSQPETSVVVVASTSWFLLFGAVRSVFDLWGHHTGGSDSQTLRSVTGIPSGLWTLLFLVLDLAGLWFALRASGLLPR